MLWKVPVIVFCLACYRTDGFTAQQMVYPGQTEFFELSIIHINDFHARFVQTNRESNTCRQGEESECIGGLARVVTVSRELLKERPNPIFLNAGDQYQGTLWYNIHKWNATAYFIDKLPQDAMTLGNHEFDDGVAGLVPFLKRIHVPVVVTNIDASEEPSMQGLYKNSTIVVRGNRTIGIIGVLTTTTTGSSRPGQNLKFVDEVESVNAEAERLKARGVNIIIVLSHVGLEIDRKIAANCPDVDVIVGGHSHTFLYSGKPPFTDDPADEYPVVVKQNSTNRTVLIVQAAAFTKYLGNLTVWFNGQGEVVDWEGNPIFLDSFIEQDPEILEELKPWAETVDAVGKRVVGETRSFLNASCRSGECNMANLITDAMIHASANYWTYAAISCIHASGVKADIPPGQITFGDLATVLPAEYTWDVVELKGLHLLRALEESISNARDKESFFEHAFLQWSGIKVVYNMSMPAWSRVHSLSVRCQACKQPIYEPLNGEQWYRVITTSYIARGGNGLTVIADKHRNLQVGPLDVGAFEDYIESISPFTYELEQRVQFIS